MKKLVVAIVLFFLSGLILTRMAAAVEVDKVMHASISAAVSGAANIYLYETSTRLGTWERIGLAGLAGIAPGLAKEAWDSRSGGSGWDNEDMAADVLGVAVGLLVAEFFCRLSGPSRYERLVFSFSPLDVGGAVVFSGRL